jgi:hypothetical protein
MPPDAPQTHPPADTAAAPTIVARPSHYWRDYRAKRLALSIALILVGLWFARDGFVEWPRQNARIEELKRERAGQIANEKRVREIDAELGKLDFHNDTAINLQKVFAFVLPPLGLFTLVWSFYHSRGQYRLAENVLHVPGHPPVPLDAITSIDKTRWDRKGIAYLDYELAGGTKGRVLLDDFVYQQRPTDDIFAHVERFTGTADDSATTA